MKALIFLIFCAGIYAQTINYSVRIIYLKQERDITTKINNFAASLEKQMNSHDWKFPHNDFEKIETNINVNIEKTISGQNYTGIITVSSGLATATRPSIALKKDIFYNELDVSFSMNYEDEPDIIRLNSSSIESIVMFYANLTLGEVFDRLSYTDQKNFRLEGDHYFTKLYEFENLLVTAADRISWKKRLDIINNYRINKNQELRKLNAYIYNAVYFYNKGKKDRAVLFIEPVIETLSNITDLPELFFMNNFYALGEVFSLSKNEEHLDFLIRMDPSHESFYSGKKPKEKPVRDMPSKNGLN